MIPTYNKKQISTFFLSLPRPVKKLIMIIVDIIICFLTVWLAYYLRTNEVIYFISINQIYSVLFSVFILIPVFIFCDFYKTIIRYSSSPFSFSLLRPIGIYGLIYAFIFTFVGLNDVPRTIGIIQPILLLLFVSTSRNLAQFILTDKNLSFSKNNSLPKILIYGAGKTGRELAISIENGNEMKVIGFIDDDSNLWGNFLDEKRIYNLRQIGNLTKKIDIHNILLAIPSISKVKKNIIFETLKELQLPVRTVPNPYDFMKGKLKIYDLQPLDVEDLLGRDPVEPNKILLEKKILNKTVLISGCGGSIGSELSKQIFKLKPRKLIIIDNNELGLYKIIEELNKINNLTEFYPILGSVQNKYLIKKVLKKFKPNIIYHAAAYKHVHIVESNIQEGLKNNIFGTYYFANLAIKFKVKDFVLISTDKAVRPTNIMGASKRLSEIILQALSTQKHSTTFSMVRFGNVLGSSGSVVPKFRQQIAEGGPITITDKKIIRYFMTIKEAAELVIQASAISKGGDVFVLDMGKPVKIYDLAKKMVFLMGYTLKNKKNPRGSIEIKITGLRPGEKLYEELLIDGKEYSTIHPRIKKIKEKFIPWPILKSKIKDLEKSINLEKATYSQSIIEDVIDNYKPAKKKVDWY